MGALHSTGAGPSATARACPPTRSRVGIAPGQTSTASTSTAPGASVALSGAAGVTPGLSGVSGGVRGGVRGGVASSGVASGVVGPDGVPGGGVTAASAGAVAACVGAPPLVGVAWIWAGAPPVHSTSAPPEVGTR